jgi:hypothetical protein
LILLAQVFLLTYFLLALYFLELSEKETPNNIMLERQRNISRIIWRIIERKQREGERRRGMAEGEGEREREREPNAYFNQLLCCEEVKREFVTCFYGY